MKLKKTAITLSAIGAGALLALGGPLAASAHVMVEPSSTAAGSYSVLTFAFSHGCDGSPTSAVAITMPDGIGSVAPTINPGWDVSVETDRADTSENPTVSQVVYTAKAPVADGLRDTLAVSVKLPDDAAGQTLAFPVVQTCLDGETDWVDLQSGDAEPDYPAPVIMVTEAVAGGGHGHGDATADAADEGTDQATEGHSDAANRSSEAAQPDVLARVFGLGGLGLGAIGLVLGVAALRKRGA